MKKWINKTLTTGLVVIFHWRCSSFNKEQNITTNNILVLVFDLSTFTLVRQWPGRPGINSRSSHTKDSKNGPW